MQPSQIPSALETETEAPTTPSPTTLLPTTLLPTTLTPTTLTPTTGLPTTLLPTTFPPTTLVPTVAPSLKPIDPPTRRQFFWVPPSAQPPGTITSRTFGWAPPQVGRSPGELDLLHHCLQSEILVDDDFETEGAEEQWMHGSTSYSRNFTFFLGRLDGTYNPKVSRTFNILPSSLDGSLASNATIEFVLYTIDDWGPDDAVSLMVGSTTIDLGQLQPAVPTSVNDTKEGISWWRNVLMQGSNLGFGAAEDMKHLVELTIPSDHFPNGTLFFEVRLETNRGGVDTLSAGMDDFILEAYYNCSGLSQRRLGGGGARNKKEREKQPSDGPYCQSNDFPCDGGDDMVYICHYSGRLRGHKTICIPERDSEILRYYTQDYCGPCLGSLSSASWMS
eukprot:Sro1135_g245050.2  (390) ;mRNA; r:17034-18203